MFEWLVNRSVSLELAELREENAKLASAVEVLTFERDLTAKQLELLRRQVENHLAAAVNLGKVLGVPEDVK